MTEREGKLDKLYYSDKVKEYLKQKIRINDGILHVINKFME